MTATADTLPWAAPLESPWTQTAEALAAEQAAGLYALANMILARPDIAPLLDVALKGLMTSVSGTRNPADALAALCRAAATNGGTATKAKFYGVDLRFSPAVCVWVMTDPPGEPEPAVVEATPEPPVDETAVTGAQDDTVESQAAEVAK